jgi:hypothetical protein
MSTQAVKTLVLSNGLDFEVVSGHIAAGNQTEEIDTTTLSDATYMTNVPRYQTEDTDLTFMCAYAGTLATIGAATLVITTLDTADGTDVCTVPVLVRSAIPQEVAIDGERRMLQQVICTPTGAAITYA